MSDETASPWLVYMVQCSDQTLYTGITNNLTQRLDRHNDGVGARYTRSRLPVALVYSESVSDRSAALRRELQIKRMTASAKRKLIAG